MQHDRLKGRTISITSKSRMPSLERGMRVVAVG
jgi:hypothetical protein